LEVIVSLRARYDRRPQSQFARRPVANCLAMLLVGMAITATAQAQTPGAQAPADEEPITPVPAPPAADPRKLALGERLFFDPHLSRDGSRSCASCHDISTNGAGSGQHEKAFDGS
jgi:cytochrome c peroxidase